MTAKLRADVPRCLLARTIESWEAFKLNHRGKPPARWATLMPRVCNYFREVLRGPVARDPAPIEATPEGLRELVNFIWVAPDTPNGGLAALGVILVPVLSRWDHAQEEREHPRRRETGESSPREIEGVRP
jgi:hypothetical protein